MATLGMFSFLAAAKYRRGLAKQLVESARLFGECMQTEPSLTSMAQAVPASAYLYWKKAMGEKYPKKTFSNADWVMSCLGLLVHFRMLAEDAGKAKHGLALASVSALSVWKSWEAGEPLEFRKFLHATLRGSIHPCGFVPVRCVWLGPSGAGGCVGTGACDGTHRCADRTPSGCAPRVRHGQGHAHARWPGVLSRHVRTPGRTLPLHRR